jgi:tetratricopeptide (TPR) repeat protein
MNYSTFLKADVNDSIATSPHIYSDSTFELSVSSTYPYNRLHAPSTCFHSNLNDMNIWIKANLNKGDYKDNEILSDSMYNLLWTPAVERRKSGYVGFGWFIDDHDDIQIISHAGGDPGYKNFLVLMPSLESGIIVMSNSESIPPQKLAYEIIDILIGKSVDLPKKPISLPIGKAIIQQNSDKAKELYYELKTSKYDSYDFSEKWLNNLGYDILIRYKFDKAIAIFKLNTEVYPESANTWDSLGDGYYWKGDKENAIKSYKKALKIDPNKQNSINRLKKLEK